ncbi:Multiple EGF-like-domain protein 3 precursor [Labilithrix luteola]|uniref:Multiple EGF-like-domain protein 3 n=1 Tax=Labilithrix luteola TaxID=1391654 RepID=A0A0K1Q2J6_9BACT|nr:Multiple EGF-like-domain protein 3 precursor [Labilithrix luteola]
MLACAANQTNVDDEPSPDAGTPDTPLATPDAGGTTPTSPPEKPDADAGQPVPDDEQCGDGHVGKGEQCDDGNNASGDGCSATCTVESAGPADLCPGTAISLSGTGADPRKGSVTGTTAMTYGQYSGTCGGGNGKEAVYVVTSDVTGLLTAKLTSVFDSLLYARRTCDDAKTEASCNDTAGNQGGEQIKIAVSQNQPVYLFVDGYAASSGDFTLDIQVDTAFCGNGIAEAPEVCDDGNTLAGDGCAADCTFEAGGILDDCPGQGFVISGTGTAPRKVSFAGTTTGLKSNTVSPLLCTGAGYNTIYSITPDVNGSLTAKLVASYDNATLHIRTECDVADTQLDCKEATDPLQVLEITVPAVAGLPHYVVVDSSSSTYNGAYALDVTLTPATCGNKVLDGAEQCDDGNTTAGDGCGADCKLEPVPPGTDNCPGAALPLAADVGGTYSGVVTGSTANLAADLKPKTAQGGCSTANTAKDAVYVVTSPISGKLTATVSGSFDSMVYVRTACDADAAAFTDLACAGSIDGNGAETLTAPILANTPVYVVVDGEATAAAGVFELRLSVAPGTCGNGELEGGETCDDGNQADGDGCSAACQLEAVTGHDTCANAEAIALAAVGDGTYSATVVSGTTNLTHDQTFTGCASAGRDAIYQIVAPIDGVVTASVPVAGFNVSLGARTAATCPTSTTGTAPLVCANASSDDGLEEISFSVVAGQTYDLIVDGTTATEFGPFTMLVRVRPPGCGDGLLSGTESCDDGNLVTGDGCSPTCTVETLAGIDTCPGYTMSLTGTGTEPRVGVLTIDTSGLVANYAGSCGGSSKDGVVVVVPPIDGKLTAKLTGITDQPVLYVRTGCNDPTTEKACDDDQPNASTTSRDISISGVKAGTPYYLFVDGYNGSAGVARLNVTVTP